MPSPFPMSPAQAAILGRGRPAPVATVNAPGAVPPAVAATGQTPIPSATPAAAGLGFSPNGMEDFLLGRANRGTPIDTGTNLLGRLAALGVGTKIQRENREGEEAATQAQSQQTIAQLVALGLDPNTAALVAKGVIAPPKPTENKAPETREVKVGNELVTEQFNTETGAWEKVAEAPRTASKLLTDEEEEQQARLKREGRSSVAVNNITGPAGAVVATKQAVEAGLITPEEGGDIIGKLTETSEEKAGISKKVSDKRVREAMGPLKARAIENIKAAAEKLAQNPFDQAAIAQYNVSLDNYAVARTKEMLPDEAVMVDDKKALRDSFPSPREIYAAGKFGQDTVGAALAADTDKVFSEANPDAPPEIQEMLKNMPPGTKFKGIK